MSIEQDVVRMVGRGLAIGENAEPSNCPFCRADHEAKFSVKRVEDGYLYNCFRGKCGAAGFVSASGSASFVSRHSQEKRAGHKAYDNSRLKGLDAEDYRFFETQWNLRKNALVTVHHHRTLVVRVLAGNVFVSPDDEYVFRIRDSRDVTRGWHVRQPAWKGVVCHRNGLVAMGKPKGMTYKNDPESPKAAWFNRESNGPLVIVEDYLSAMKVFQAGFRALCLFGTSITDADRQEIRSQGIIGGTVLWLDADAQDQAYRNVQRHGVNLNMRVVCTTKDPKALSELAIQEVIG
jgi:hypothetical protein